MYVVHSIEKSTPFSSYGLICDKSVHHNIHCYYLLNLDDMLMEWDYFNGYLRKVMDMTFFLAVGQSYTINA